MATLKNGDCTIWYDSMGGGLPVVMVYGIGGHSRQWWEDFPRLVSQRYRLVMLDNRGAGFSDRPEEPWTMQDMTGDVQAVVDELDLSSFHLLGCSLGSVVVRHYVGDHGGEQLRSLSLFCPPNGVSATQDDLSAALWWDRSKPLLDQARRSWPIVHPEPWIAQNDALLVAKFEEGLKDATPGRTYQYQLEAVQAAGDPNAALSDYSWPVLIAHGTVDRLVPPENARTLKQAVPRARLELLEGESHSFWQHNPVRAAGVLLSFLDDAEQIRGGG